MQEKVWVVIQQCCGELGSVLAFDTEADAQNFAEEMTAAGKGTNTVVQTTLDRSSDADRMLSHVDLPEFDTECIECLVDMSDVPEAKQDTAAKFLADHREELQKNAQQMVDTYIKKALTDYITDDRVILG